MSRIYYFKSGKINRFYRQIKKTAKENGRNPLAMFADFLYCSFKFGAGLSDYINFKFYNMKNKERREYVTVVDCDKFYALLSPDKYKKFFTIKPDFLKNFKKYISRDYCTYEMGFEKFNSFLENNAEFMLKPIDGLGGHGVRRVETREIEDRRSFFEALNTEGLFVEGYVVQHSEMSAFSENSVNTLRIMTYANNDESFIFYAIMRVGRGAQVDNFHQGGLACKVDVETGRLVGKAMDKLGEEFEEHPVSKIKFDGFRIPNWDYVVKMVNEAALVNQNIHVVGWDVAVLEDGATFIEGNRRPGWDLVQSLDRCGSKFRMREILQRYNEDEKKKDEK